eukprot:gene24072-1055_t
MSTEEIEAKVRGSYSLSEEYVRSVLTNPRDYDTVAPTITRVLIDILADMCTKGGFTADNRALVVGMEVAGGIMASQIAAV